MQAKNDYRERYPDMYDEKYERQVIENRLHALVRNSGVSSDYIAERLTIDSYPSDAATIVKEWAREVADRPGLYLFGSVGSGKTHLAQAAIVEAVRQSSRRCLFVSAHDMIQQARETNDPASDLTESELLAKWIQCAFLAIDDLGSERPTDYSISILYRVIDRRVQMDLPTLITSNFDLDLLGDRLDCAGRYPIEADRILDRLNGHCVRVEMPGRSHRIGATT